MKTNLIEGYVDIERKKRRSEVSLRIQALVSSAQRVAIEYSKKLRIHFFFLDLFFFCLLHETISKGFLSWAITIITGMILVGGNVVLQAPSYLNLSGKGFLFFFFECRARLYVVQIRVVERFREKKKKKAIVHKKYSFTITM